MRSPLSDPQFPQLKAYVIEHTGLAYYEDKDEELATRIRRRLSASRLPDCGAYLRRLQDGDAGERELDALVKDLTIGETFFFRHQEQFDALREVVLPDVLERNETRRQLRIWSAGCSIGSEAYSVGILLRRDFADWISGWDISIIGTDINREFLSHARRGLYRDWALRSLPEETRQSYFTGSSNAWSILPEHREWVSFQYHNLATHPFPSLVNNLAAFDVILCRNVLMYFDWEMMSRIVSQLRECLVDGGWLLVGPSEGDIRLFRSFRTVNTPGATLHQRCERGTPEPEWVAPVLEPQPPIAPVSGQEDQWPASLTTVAGLDGTATPRERLAPFRDVDEWLASFNASESEATEPAPSRPDMTEVRRLADRGEWPNALQLCRELVDGSPLEPQGHFYQALVLEQMGNAPESETSLRRAIYLDRGFVLAHYHLGLLLQRQGDLQAAARAFRNAYRLLDRMEETDAFPDADGMTVADLKELVAMQTKEF